MLVTNYNGGAELLQLSADIHSLCLLPPWQEIYVELSVQHECTMHHRAQLGHESALIY